MLLSFIRHSIVDNSFYTSELGFSYNNNLYYLPATESEFDLIEKPLYEARKAYLTSVFGSEKCSSVGIGICYNCNIRPNVRVGVCATGYAEANSEEGYMCRVSIENDRTISNCAEFQPT